MKSVEDAGYKYVKGKLIKRRREKEEEEESVTRTNEEKVQDTESESGAQFSLNVVKLDDGKEYVAAIEFDSEISKKYMVNKEGDNHFNTIITVFEPDVERNGEEYDYLEYLTSRIENEELEIKKELSTAESAHAQSMGTGSAIESSKSSIHQTDPKFNSSEQNSSEKVSTDDSASFSLPNKNVKRNANRDRSRTYTRSDSNAIAALSGLQGSKEKRD